MCFSLFKAPVRLTCLTFSANTKVKTKRIDVDLF